jgi:hypothetical protein
VTCKQARLSAEAYAGTWSASKQGAPNAHLCASIQPDGMSCQPLSDMAVSGRRGSITAQHSQ